MLALDDPRWSDYDGGRRVPYDASVALRLLFAGGSSPALWHELWDELHHQGDMDTAAYAAVPWLLEFARRSPTLDWNVFGLVACIELERPAKRNPAVPSELRGAYFQALESVPALLAEHPERVWDPSLTPCAVACVALARGQRQFARVYLDQSLEAGLAWLHEETGYDPADDT